MHHDIQFNVMLRVHGYEEVVTMCDECPAFCDPDPYPCFCRLDYSYRGRNHPSDVAAGGDIPHNCPLLTLKVSVIRRGGTPE